MYLPFERNNGEELKNLILYQGFFFPSVIPYLPKKNSKQNPFKQTKKQSEFEYKELKKKKERKKNQCQFKIGHLDKLSFEQFFHEYPFISLHSL